MLIFSIECLYVYIWEWPGTGGVWLGFPIGMRLSRVQNHKGCKHFKCKIERGDAIQNKNR